MGEVVAVMFLGCLVLYFMGAIRVREVALQAVARASREGDFQLLDQSVHIQKLSLSRDKNRRWRIWRQYRFDYTFDGANRRQGFVVMLGRNLESIVVAENTPTLH